MKKTIDFIKKNWILFFMIVLLLIIFIPIFVNNIFNHPVADDYYNYNLLVQLLNGKDINFFTYFEASIERIKYIYTHNQGQYFSLLLGTYHPFFFSFSAYKILMFSIQLFYLFSVFYFFASISKIINSISFKTSIILSIVYIILSVCFMYDIAECFYWYAGEGVYTIPYALSMVYFGTLIRYITNQSKKMFILNIVLTIFLAGTNYSTGILIGSILFFLLIYNFFKNSNIKKNTIILFAVFCIGFSFNVLAPGNFVRISQQEKVSIIKALVMTIPLACNMIYYTIFKTLLIPCLIFLTPLFAEIANKLKYMFKHPLLFSILTIGVFSLLFAPMTYAYGNYWQEPRLQNVQFAYLLLMLILMHWYFVGYIVKNNKSIVLKNSNFKEVSLIFGIVILLVMIPVIGFENSNIKLVANDIIYGNSRSYNSCMEYNYRTIKESKDSIVYIKNCPNVAKSLHYNEWTNEYNFLPEISKYFKKQIVMID